MKDCATLYIIKLSTCFEINGSRLEPFVEGLKYDLRIAASISPLCVSSILKDAGGDV